LVAPPLGAWIETSSIIQFAMSLDDALDECIIDRLAQKALLVG
jgi:hypothetical protein